MALHLDLLTQAGHLSRKEPQRPKQASLRRAVSSAYYALFHFLVDRATAFIVAGASPHRRKMRQTVARAFEHGQMKKVCKAFATNNANAWKDLSSDAIPEALERVAQTFVDLQQARHEADYDLTRDFARGEVQSFITQVEQAIRDWTTVAAEPHAEAFLLALVFKSR